MIKIESLSGDTARWLGPPERAGLNGFFTQHNRNKRAIALDLKSEQGREIAQELARRADVVIENFRPGVADRLGIGYEQLKQDNPGLVYVSISGFGPDGPYANQPVYDLMIQGMSGMMPIQGGDGPPQMFKSVIADKNAAITAASCTLAALLARERDSGQGRGLGQHVQVPMLNAYAQLTMPDNMTTESFQPKPEFEGTIPDMFRVWECSDGHLVGMVILDKQYQGLCDCLGREDLAQDERFVEMGARMQNNHALNEILAEEFRKWACQELLQKLREHQVESLASCKAHFNTVIPLSFIPDGSDFADLPGPTGLDDLKTLALSRLMCTNIPHIKAFWIMQTPKLAQVSLNWGVDDIDGTVVYYDITKKRTNAETSKSINTDARDLDRHVSTRNETNGSTHQELTLDQLKRLIVEAGCEPVERDTLYRRVIRDHSSWRLEG